MCGIIFAKSTRNPVASAVLTQYLAQRNRGNLGFGLIRITKDKTDILKATQESKAVKLINKSTQNTILFHHRFPTSTGNTISGAHPYLVTHRKRTFAVVHNGIITNDDILADRHDALKIKYTSLQPNGTFNDSEALAHDIARVIVGLQDAPLAEGSAAVMALEIKDDKAIKLWYFRNRGNPLNLIRFNDFTLIASEAKGGQPIPENTLFCLDLATNAITEHGGIHVPYTSYYPTWEPTKSSSKRQDVEDDEETIIPDTHTPSKKFQIGFTKDPLTAEEVARLDLENEDAEAAIWDMQISKLNEEVIKAYEAQDYELAERLEHELETLGAY